MRGCEARLSSRGAVLRHVTDTLSSTMCVLGDEGRVSGNLSAWNDGQRSLALSAMRVGRFGHRPSAGNHDSKIVKTLVLYAISAASCQSSLGALLRMSISCTARYSSSRVNYHRVRIDFGLEMAESIPWSVLCSKHEQSCLLERDTPDETHCFSLRLWRCPRNGDSFMLRLSRPYSISLARARRMGTRSKGWDLSIGVI